MKENKDRLCVSRYIHKIQRDASKNEGFSTVLRRAAHFKHALQTLGDPFEQNLPHKVAMSTVGLFVIGGYTYINQISGHHLPSLENVAHLFGMASISSSASGGTTPTCDQEILDDPDNIYDVTDQNAFASGQYVLGRHNTTYPHDTREIFVEDELQPYDSEKHGSGPYYDSKNNPRS